MSPVGIHGSLLVALLELDGPDSVHKRGNCESLHRSLLCSKIVTRGS